MMSKNKDRFDITFATWLYSILRGDIINANNLLLVVHESDLPNGRGFSPFTMASTGRHEK